MQNIGATVAKNFTLAKPCDAAMFQRIGLIVYRPPLSLRLFDKKLRPHSTKKIAKMMASIEQFGFVMPVLLSADGEVIAGEARIEAATRLGMVEVPTITASHLTPAQVRAYRIADNRLPELSQWDRPALAAEISAIIELGTIDVQFTAFETAETDVLIGELGETLAVADPDDDVPPRAVAISEPGDLWLLGRHRLICGSSRVRETVERLMAGATAAMVFSDPPFNCAVNGHVSGSGRHPEFQEASGEMSSPEFILFLTQALSNAMLALKDGGILDICMDHRHLPELFAAAAACNLSVLNLCVWDKGSGGMGSLYRSQYELVLILKKGKAPHCNNVQLGKYGRYRTSIWSYAGANSFGKARDADLADHPTVKPLAMVADAIRDVTHAGEIVFDGFMGAGTTILAAERTKRIGYGVEIDGVYVDVAIRRWEKMTGGKAVLAETGETFAAVEARRRVAPVGQPLSDARTADPERTPIIRQRQRPRPLAA